MKITRILALLLAVMMLFVFSACSGGGTEDGNKKEKETEKTEESGAKTDTEDDKLSLGDHVAELVGYEIVKDSDGNDAIAITYNYTNNSDEESSFSWTFYDEVTQNGEELEFSVVFVSEDSYDTLDHGDLDEIAPGESIEVCQTYTLKDTVSPVVISATDLYEEYADTLTIEIA
ncbi:MAG: DUF5067 domain-containing protein [Clostridia bacterium]|nr:DUF5067 domain-containing protein [Clostridia bacterium]